MEELLSLKWNNHKSTFLHILTILRDKQLYTDSTLACEGKFYNVHRLVLSTCSDYFSAMFDRTECKNPIIVLKDIKCVDLEALLDYMYLGEVNVKQSELSSLIKAAECLQVKGLAVPDDEPPSKRNKKSDSNHSPSAKRKRRDEEDHSASLPKSARSHLSEDRISTTDPSTSVIDETDKVPFVKVEKEDSEGESYDINNANYKVENNDSIHSESGDISNELPEFMHSDDPFSDRSYSGTSYQPGDVDWPGEGSNFSGQINYNAVDTNSNASGNHDFTLWKVDKGGRLKQHLCNICNRTFASIQDLNRHHLIHTGEKPFACPYCKHKSNRKGNLKLHIMSTHPELKKV